MESVGVVAAAGRDCVGVRGRGTGTTIAAARKASAKAEAGVDEAKVIEAFGLNHGFPVRGGKVAWAALTETLEEMRRKALAAG